LSKEKVKPYLVKKKGYRISPRGHIYKSYRGFRLSLSFSNNRLSHFIIHSIDYRDFGIYEGNYVKRGRIIETLEALQQDVGALRRKVFPKSKKFVAAVSIMYSDLNSLWGKV